MTRVLVTRHHHDGRHGLGGHDHHHDRHGHGHYGRPGRTNHRDDPQGPEAVDHHQPDSHGLAARLRTAAAALLAPVLGWGAQPAA